MTKYLLITALLLSGCGELPTVVHTEETPQGRQEVDIACHYSGICLWFNYAKYEYEFSYTDACKGHYKADADIVSVREVLSDDTDRTYERQDNITLKSTCS